jgi:hypothetical protein
MRGVLSVLGLDQASQAVLRMRDSVEEILVTEVDEEKARAAGTFDKLGNNLGALGFLIDMLSYQRALAKKLFVYDDKTGELKPLMGRAAGRADEPPMNRRMLAVAGGHVGGHELPVRATAPRNLSMARHHCHAGRCWQSSHACAFGREACGPCRPATRAPQSVTDNLPRSAAECRRARWRGHLKPTSKKMTCATSSWKKRAKWCKTAWPPWRRWQQTPSNWRAHHAAPRLPHAQGQLPHGGADRVWRSRPGHGAVAQHLAG